MSTDETKELEIENVLRIERLPGGLSRAVVSTPEAQADVHLQGAHVTHWTPQGQHPVLFVSPISRFVPGKAIRGGVPIVWPWFGPRRAGRPGPDHGFARITDWDLESSRLHDGKVEIGLALTPNDVSRNLGYEDFRVTFRLTIGATLRMELETHNDSREELRYEEALHSYFAIADINRVSIAGLQGTTYIDQTDKFQRKQQGDEPIRIAKETDQIHLNTLGTCVLHDEVWDRRIVVEKSGSDSTVVWNPWIEKTKTLSDMRAEDWRKMLCVESANVRDNAITLAPGASHKLTVSIYVE
jgi:glucose-6-phosphate 1-epimerase